MVTAASAAAPVAVVSSSARATGRTRLSANGVPSRYCARYMLLYNRRRRRHRSRCRCAGPFAAPATDIT